MREATNEDSGKFLWLEDEGQNGMTIAKFRCIVEDVGEPRKFKDEDVGEPRKFKDEDGLIWDHAWVPETQDDFTKFRLQLLEDKVAKLDDKIDNLIDRLRGD